LHSSRGSETEVCGERCVKEWFRGADGGVDGGGEGSVGREWVRE
jgi:hypothetical protein